MTTVTLVDLPIEIFHYICNYLDTKTILVSLRSTCRQLHAFVHGYDRFELDFNTIRKFHFELIHNIIGPENITSIILSLTKWKAQNSQELFLSCVNTERFTHLRSLSISDVPDTELDSLLNNFNLSFLNSLNIHCSTTYKSEPIKVLSVLLGQPHFHRLKLIGTYNITKSIVWPTQSYLRRLTVTNCTFEQYQSILSQCPFLQTMTMKQLYSYNFSSSVFTLSSNTSSSKLSSLTVTDSYIDMTTLKAMLSITPSLTQLKLFSMMFNKENIFDGSLWETLIETELPMLNDFQFFFQNQLYTYNETINLHNIIKGYQTPFWLETKRWFVNCECLIGPRSSQLVVYTTPFQMKDITAQIRCQASSSSDICELLILQPDEKDQSDATEIVTFDLERKAAATCCIPYLSCALKHRSATVSINLRDNYIRATQIKHLTDAMQNGMMITSLNLDTCGIDHQAVEQLADTLKSNETLTTLSMGGNQIGPIGTRHLCALMQSNTTLTQLLIGGNRLSPQALFYLSDVLSTNKTLTVLDLQDNGIKDEGVEYLCNCLMRNTILSDLHLGTNQIGIHGAKALANLLEKNTGLSMLNLKDNEIRSDGVQPLAHALIQNQTLSILNLRMNQIDDDGAEYLVDALQFNTTLATLILSNNRILGSGCRHLCDGLKKNIKLTSIDLGRNEIGNMGCIFLADVLQKNTTLRTINICCNKIHDKGVFHMATVLKYNTTLRFLDLGENRIGDNGAVYLLEALKENKILNHLNLDLNAITRDLAIEINGLVEKNKI